MADIEYRALVPERMEFGFTMREIDAEGRVVRCVQVDLDCPDSITHTEVTEAYENFLRACGYVIEGEIRYVRRGSEF